MDDMSKIFSISLGITISCFRVLQVFFKHNKTFQKYKVKMLCSEHLYLTACNISCCTLRYCYIAPNLQWR